MTRRSQSRRLSGHSSPPATNGSSLHLPSLRRRLLAWFDREQRDLPWRRNRDPYSIWISEVMLQQTQVATVIPYFERFISAFPTLAALAAADEHDVLRLWEGLGYYRRARDLHRAARILMAEHDGQLPDAPQVWASLPGIGRYIANAVLSQAFDRRLPVVEANTRRVLARLFGRRDDLGTKAAQDWLWSTAAALLPRTRAGDFNQALMELGALLCTAGSPRCGQCPVAGTCTARREGLQEVIPLKTRRPLPEEVREVAVVVRRRRRLLLVRRRADATRWANMWEFPHITLNSGEAHEDAACRLLGEQLGVDAGVGQEVLTIRHGVTRFRITMVCLEATYRRGAFRPGAYAEARWLEPAELAGYAVSSSQRRLAEALIAPDRQSRLF
jgi:A/G-specific adenine glycosylase